MQQWHLYRPSAGIEHDIVFKVKETRVEIRDSFLSKDTTLKLDRYFTIRQDSATAY